MNTLINAIVPALRLAIPFGIIALVFCIIRKYDRKKTTYWTLFSAYIGAVIGETILSGQRYASRSISRKNIRGCDCYYQQYREGDKIVSKYIKKAELDELAAKIEKRRILRKTLRDIDAEMKKIERTIK